MNRKTTLNMTLLPLILIVLLILGTGYFLMEGEIKLPKFGRGAQMRRLEGFPTSVYTDKMLEKQRRVIKNEQELGEFLNYVDPNGSLTLKEKVNFDKEYLLGVSSETESETEHEIKVRRIYENKNNKTLLVSVRETIPGQKCKVEQDKNVNVDLVVISKTDWTIEFEKVKRILECK